MFAELLADCQQRPAAMLDDEFASLELAARQLAGRRLAVIAAAEANQTPALDGHRSTQAYLRARTNQPARAALVDVLRARLCRQFPQVGEALITGRIGLGQIDELVRITRNPRAVTHLDDSHVDMLLGHAEHLPIREFALIVNRWLLWADPDGAWRDQVDSIANRSAHVVAVSGEVSIGVTGGDVLTAETLTQIFAHFVELEFRKDCEARRAEHGQRAAEFALPRSDSQRRFDAIVAIFQRAYEATSTGRMPDPVVNIICDQRTMHDLLGRAGIVLTNGAELDLDQLTRRQIDAVLAEFVADPKSILSRRCETSSGHPIPPQLLIQALLTAHVRRVVLGSNSTVIDFGQRQRLFTGNGRLAATLLERFCRHDGCEVSADRSQIDHDTSHADGGPTDQDNAAPLCGPHNRFKYRKEWRTRRADNGRTYNIRSDGTVVLFIGERPPAFTQADAAERTKRGLAHLETIRQRLQSSFAA
jgi:hypothetical protein